MVKYPIAKMLRLDYELKVNCELAAAKARLSCCEWIREAMYDKLQAGSRRNGKRRINREMGRTA